jgi:hypothetical protein
MADYRFDGKSQRYRDVESGRYISDEQVRAGVDAMVSLSAGRMADLSRQYRAGTITADRFLAGMMSEIKAAHVAGAIAAYGGREAMTAARWGTVGQQIRVQYSYARAMVGDVLDGRQRLNGRLDSRSSQYAGAARATFEAVRRGQKRQAGYAFERNVTHSQEGCSQCQGLSSRGAVPIGTLPPIGQRTCKNACKCEIVYSRTLSESEAA